MEKESLSVKAGAQLWKLAQNLYTERLVNAAYRGVLGRAPDVAGAEAYGRALRTHEELPGIIASLVDSEEFAQRHLSLRAPGMVRSMADRLLGAAFEGASARDQAIAQAEQGDLQSALTLLVRSDAFWKSVFAERSHELQDHLVRAIFDGGPGTEITEEWAGLLRQGPSGLTEVITRALNSNEVWERQLAGRSDELIQAAFSTLLGRGAEPAAIAEYRGRIQSTAGFAGVLSDIGKSDEAWQRQVELHSEELLHALFSGVLKRKADLSEQHAYAQRLRNAESLGSLAAEVARSDEFWRKNLGERADLLVRICFNALLGREPDQDALAKYAGELSHSHDLAALVANIAGSSEHWERSFRAHADELVQTLYQGLLGRDAEPAALQSYARKLNAPIDLAGLAAAIGNSNEFWKSSLQAHRREIVRAIYEGIFGSEPAPALVEDLASRITDVDDFRTSLGEIVESREFKKKLLDTQAEDFVRALYRGMLGRDPEARALESYSSKLRESGDLKGLAAAINGSVEHERYVETLNWRRQFTSMCTAILQRLPTPDEYSAWESVRKLTPSEEYSQLVLKWLVLQRSKEQGRLQIERVATGSRRLSILFVHGAKKEKDSLFPVFEKLNKEGSATRKVVLCDVVAAVDYFANFPNDRYVLVTAFEHSHRKLKAAGLEGIFVYMEHGVAPLKAYTYAPHYRGFDYSLLPGDLWCERLKLLYPELSGDRLYTVGYPKLAIQPVTETQKIAYAQRLGLNAGKKIVLFAPTWSGGNPELGISNIKYLKSTENYIAIAHDGDTGIAAGLKKLGYPIHMMSDGETISEHYAFADILVTDISSTAIEFARLGKPVICIKTPSYPDFEEKFIGSNGVPVIPHTAHSWDFCPVVERAQVGAELEKVITMLHGGAFEPDASSLVTEMCACYGQEAVERCSAAIEKIIDENYTEARPQND